MVRIRASLVALALCSFALAATAAPPSPTLDRIKEARAITLGYRCLLYTSRCV